MTTTTTTMTTKRRPPLPQALLGHHGHGHGHALWAWLWPWPQLLGHPGHDHVRQELQLQQALQPHHHPAPHLLEPAQLAPRPVAVPEPLAKAGTLPRWECILHATSAVCSPGTTRTIEAIV